ncbi:hypothetical protein BJX64DRAFT_291436 [Aspergillus heterothallicus]
MDVIGNLPYYEKNMPELEQVRRALEVRAQRRSQVFEWPRSIVDLLELLDLASDIHGRSRLASLLNVENFLPGSPLGNMTLYRAIIQELARNGGDLPRSMRNKLVGSGRSASIVGMDSDHCEVESIFSDNSTTSSMSASSQTSNPAREIAHLLLNTNALTPLLRIAYARYTSRFTRKLKGLVSQFGRDLVSEAVGDAQRAAAQFVREAARQIATQLNKAMAPEAENSIVSNRRELENLLLAQSSQRQAANDAKEPISDAEADHSEKSESERELSLPLLQEVEQFMVESRAFADLVARIREWLGILDEKIDEKGDLNLPIEQIIGSPEFSNPIKSAIPEETAYLRTPELSQQHSKLDTSNKEANQSFLRRVLLRVTQLEPMFWPKPPEGFKRITWRSPLGKPLYIDVKEREEGAAERLQERFTASSQGSSSASSSSSSSSSSFSRTPGTVSSITAAMTPYEPPAAHVQNRSSNHSAVSHHANVQYSQPSLNVSATVPNNMRQASGKYLQAMIKLSFKLSTKPMTLSGKMNPGPLKYRF